MELGFSEVLLFGGALLAIAAALSGLFKGTVLSISVLAVRASASGLAGADVIEVSAADDTVIYLIELALIVTLFSDGLFVRARAAASSTGARPVRALTLAMPLTLLLPGASRPRACSASSAGPRPSCSRPCSRRRTRW